MFNFLNKTLNNDKDISNIEEKFNELIDAYALYSTRTNDDNYLNLIADQDRILKDISNIIYERFGIKNKIKKGKVIAGISPMPTVYNLRKLDKLLEDLKKDILREKHSKNMVKAIHNFEKVKKDMERGLHIDYDDMFIDFKEDSEFTIYLDVEFLINKKNFNSRELVSVLLHEIGHIFDSLGKLSVVTKGTITIMIDIVGSVVNNEDLQKGITIATRDLDTDNDNGDIKVFLESYKNFLNSNLDTYYTPNTKLDSEYFADSVSAKFGYGVDLTQALSKLQDTEFENDDFTLKVIGFTSIIIALNLLLGIGIGVMLLLIVSLTFLKTSIITLAYLMAGMMSIMLSKLLNTTNISNDLRGHPDIKERTTKIKQNLISLLRKTKDEETANELLKEIKTLNSILDKINNNSVLNELGNGLKVFSITTEAQLFEIADTLINNDLYIKSRELKTQGV